VRIRGYFSKPNAVREKKKIGQHWPILIGLSAILTYLTVLDTGLCCTLCKKSAAYVNALYPAYCVASYWNGSYRSLNAIVAQSRNCLFAFNTLRTGDADLCFYITTVQDG